jgi:putative glutamine amidotransferase
MSRPVIAMPQWGNNLLRLYMKSKYVFSLHRAGARIRWIEMDDPDLAEKTRDCDGLLLPGGDDIDPSRYGQPRQEKCGKSCELRDQAEWKMLEAFLPTGKPILGICRGCQLINVALGGTLWQDLPSQQPSDLLHVQKEGAFEHSHSVSILPNTPLAEVLGQSRLTINSLHHQAAKDIGRGLQVMAKADDGIVEAMYLPEHPFLWALQWHPERPCDIDADARALFSRFITACG